MPTREMKPRLFSASGSTALPMNPGGLGAVRDHAVELDARSDAAHMAASVDRAAT